MPSFDRVVSIGPPSRALYVAQLDSLETFPYTLDDGDNVSKIDVPGEFAYATAAAAGVIGWFDPNDLYNVERTRFQAATRLLVVAPGGEAGEGGLPVGSDLLGGRITFHYGLAGAAPVPLFRHNVTAGALTAGRYEWSLGGYVWFPAATPYGDTRLDQIRYVLDMAFEVRGRKSWARLMDAGSFDVVTAQTPEIQQTRRYLMRYDESVSTFNELTDAGERWNIVSVEPEGRRRTMELECQRIVSDASRNVEL